MANFHWRGGSEFVTVWQRLMAYAISTRFTSHLRVSERSRIQQHSLRVPAPSPQKKKRVRNPTVLGSAPLRTMRPTSTAALLAAATLIGATTITIPHAATVKRTAGCGTTTGSTVSPNTTTPKAAPARLLHPPPELILLVDPNGVGGAWAGASSKPPSPKTFNSFRTFNSSRTSSTISGRGGASMIIVFTILVASFILYFPPSLPPLIVPSSSLPSFKSPFLSKRRLRRANHTIPSLPSAAAFHTIACAPVCGNFAAFATGSGSFFTDNGGVSSLTDACTLTRTPLPVLEIHGGSDMDGPYAGGAGEGGTEPVIVDWCVLPSFSPRAKPLGYAQRLPLRRGRAPLALGVRGCGGESVLQHWKVDDILPTVPLRPSHPPSYSAVLPSPLFLCSYVLSSLHFSLTHRTIMLHFIAAVGDGESGFKATKSSYPRARISHYTVPDFLTFLPPPAHFLASFLPSSLSFYSLHLTNPFPPSYLPTFLPSLTQATAGPLPCSTSPRSPRGRADPHRCEHDRDGVF
ncbi:hypothetical protein B0H14DRAFT_3880232 [Mycena olivaceomarginata]|nr:hypothetical protein B0H14DRAFT_3880232 [Mycena olivaceomarginata]